MKINKHIGKTDNCPECGFDFKGEDIYEYFLKQGNLDEEAFRVSLMYGYSFENKKCFRKEIAIETRQGYDGCTWYHCPECKVYWKRFDWSDPKYLS